MIICKILAKGRTIWFGGWFWSMEPYHRIVIEAEKFSPKFASRGSKSNGRYILIVLRTCKMADGVLTSSLEKSSCKLFFGTQVCRKTGGHVLTPDFGTFKNLIKMASNGKVLKERKFSIIKKRNFDI